MTFAKWGRLVGVLLLALAAFSPADPVWAQGGEGRIYGTVMDPSGAVIQGAAIRVRNEKTGEERVVSTDGEGNYNVTNLKPSFYTVEAVATGFATSAFNGLQLN